MGFAQEEQRNGDHVEQQSLLSPEELETRRFRAPAAASTLSSQTDKVRKPRRPEGDAVQDELPFRR
jgi:hypothetical protein